MSDSGYVSFSGNILDITINSWIIIHKYYTRFIITIYSMMTQSILKLIYLI